MLGHLPTTVEVDGVGYAVNTDYRNILRIFTAFHSEELSEEEKALVCMMRLYKNFNDIPQTDYKAAYEAAFSFIECNAREDKPSPRVVNWEKDEHMIFPAINKVAGCEVRALPYLHWWTFLGHFQSVDHESLWGFVLSIRQKKAKGKKLEKHEQEFFRSNGALVLVEDRAIAQTAEDTLKAMFDSLAEEE